MPQVLIELIEWYSCLKPVGGGSATTLARSGWARDRVAHGSPNRETRRDGLSKHGQAGKQRDAEEEKSIHASQGCQPAGWMGVRIGPGEHIA